MRSSGSWSFTLILMSDSIPKKGANASGFGIELTFYFKFLQDNTITQYVVKKAFRVIRTLSSFGGKET